MRDIKFRAWHKINKTMLPNKDLSVLAKNIRDDNIWAYMQYTGMKDKNGVEIYEGDIVRYPEGRSVDAAIVTYSDIWGSWYANNCDGKKFERSEVIGNAYEHEAFIKARELVTGHSCKGHRDDC